MGIAVEGVPRKVPVDVIFKDFWVNMWVKIKLTKEYFE